MKKQQNFAMKIEDVFEFSGGRTVFAGTIEGTIDFVRPCECDLWIGEQLVDRFMIEPEMLPMGKKESTLRTVSTTHRFLSVDLTLLRSKGSNAWLRCDAPV